MNVCSIWLFAQISDDVYYLNIRQCARYFVAALFKELAFNYHQTNVRSRVSVSNFQVQVSVSAFTTKSRSRRLRSRLHHCLFLSFSYFTSRNKELKSGNYFFDVCCANQNILVRC